jgi:hypothetical protein
LPFSRKEQVRDCVNNSNYRQFNEQYAEVDRAISRWRSKWLPFDQDVRAILDAPRRNQKRAKNFNARAYHKESTFHNVTAFI